MGSQISINPEWPHWEISREGTRKKEKKEWTLTRDYGGKVKCSEVLIGDCGQWQSALTMVETPDRSTPARNLANATRPLDNLCFRPHISMDADKFTLTISAFDHIFQWMQISSL
jgi:hypothetical protein